MTECYPAWHDNKIGISIISERGLEGCNRSVRPKIIAMLVIAFLLLALTHKLFMMLLLFIIACFIARGTASSWVKKKLTESFGPLRNARMEKLVGASLIMCAVSIAAAIAYFAGRFGLETYEEGHAIERVPLSNLLSGKGSLFTSTWTWQPEQDWAVIMAITYYIKHVNTTLHTYDVSLLVEDQRLNGKVTGCLSYSLYPKGNYTSGYLNYVHEEMFKVYDNGRESVWLMTYGA